MSITEIITIGLGYAIMVAVFVVLIEWYIESGIKK